mgnify:CR=1 FL=1
MENNIYDLAILGAGPAGICAAIYATRAKLNTIWLDRKFVQGGQIVDTYEVDNYPGLPGITGLDLGEAMAGHAEKLGLKPKREPVLSVTDEGEIKVIRTKKNEYHARAVIIACGATHRHLGIPGEEELGGMGVSYCATCDGAFFRERVTAVIGGGDSAVEDVIFLSRICKKVYMIHRRDSLKASKSLQSVLDKLENVEILWDTVAEAIKGNSEVETLQIKNQKTQEKRELSVDGVFVAVGAVPNTKEFQNLIQLDEAGYIAAEEDCRTNVAGIYAAGDIRTKALRQVVTAVSDGANAVYSAQKYLSELA